MKIDKQKYRFTSLLLLVTLLSHISIFHAPMQEKILCAHDDGSVHLENISESEFAVNILFPLQKATPVFHQNCNDYRLDFHVDQINAKQIHNYNLSQRVFLVINLKRIKTHLIQFSLTRQQLPQLTLQNYSTVSLLI